MTDSNLRSVSLTRTGVHTFEATNVRGGRFSFGEGSDTDFTPVELLLAAIGGCSSIDVDYLTSRRAEPETFEVTVTAPKLSDDQGNHLGEVVVDFRIRFPAGEGGDAARQRLVPAVVRSRDRLCTVSRTVQLPTDVTYQVEGRTV
ncbi:MAG: OsmC family protein [Propionicimonas sp.]